MIDINTYRMRIGCFNPFKNVFKNNKVYNTVYGARYCEYNSFEYNYSLFYILYIYTIMFMLCFSQLVLISGLNIGNTKSYVSWVQPTFLHHSKWDLPLLTIIHVKIMYFCRLSYVFKKFVSGLHRKYCMIYRLQYLTPANIFFGNSTSRARQLISVSIIYVMSLNFILIGIVNPSMLNPGPQNLTVYYQNIQGLIPFSHLSNDHPPLALWIELKFLNSIPKYVIINLI